MEAAFLVLALALRVEEPVEDEHEDDAPASISVWDPPTHEEVMDASRCRALLLEIVRRAAHDFILYRTNRKMRKKAEDAYTWLFEEKPGHPWWEMRKKSGMMIASFLTICEVLDLDPKETRSRIREMTPQQIMTAGRPAERRSRSIEETHNYTEHGVTDNVSLSELEESEEGQLSSMYEAYFAVYTSD